LVGRALGIQERPAGSKTLIELRAEFGVSRSIMQKAVKKLILSGELQKARITERGPDGKTQQTVVYWKA
jgi:DNA-binding transcriptional regulator PaaX